MPDPRFRRRKKDRPAEITAAAMDEFAEHGYDATPVEAVARRAGVSKGLMYLYFRTKEELFKAVIQSAITPRLDKLVASVEASEAGVEAFLRGPYLEFARELPRSRARHLIRLMVAEGHKHPDLTAWYWEHVVSRGLGALQALIERGVKSGELKPSALQRFPQMLLSPVVLSVLWTLVMARHQPLDTDAFIEAYIDLLLEATRAEPATEAAP